MYTEVVCSDIETEKDSGDQQADTKQQQQQLENVTNVATANALQLEGRPILHQSFLASSGQIFTAHAHKLLFSSFGSKL